MNHLIIVAGGSGKRMNLGFNKIFVKLGGFPIIYWTILAFERSKTVQNIIISASEEDILKIRALVKRSGFGKVKDITVAGPTRQQSTFEILKMIKLKIKDKDLVGIHNGANPFVTAEEIKKVFLAAKKHGAALLAQPARDTVKIADADTFVESTPLRQFSWYAQTPQVATFGNLWKAFVFAERQKFTGTDDAQLLERVGIRPKIIACTNLNVKITFREDIQLAKQILKNFLKNNKL
ncbi:MAG: 2-C-methyl-D-erythritol 4-phosphate cytidylyltransferase [Patescibacteria group bacterium]